MRELVVMRTIEALFNSKSSAGARQTPLNTSELRMQKEALRSQSDYLRASMPFVPSHCMPGAPKRDTLYHQIARMRRIQIYFLATNSGTRRGEAGSAHASSRGFSLIACRYIGERRPYIRPCTNVYICLWEHQKICTISKRSTSRSFSVTKCTHHWSCFEELMFRPE
jgi:hypothetical protein